MKQLNLFLAGRRTKFLALLTLLTMFATTMWGTAPQIDLRGKTSALVLPKANSNSSYTSGDWRVMAPSNTTTASSQGTITQSAVTYGTIDFIYTGDAMGDYCLQFTKNTGNITTTILSDYGVDITIKWRQGSGGTITASLTGTDNISNTKTGKGMGDWGTREIGTTTTSATFTISASSAACGVQYIVITPKAGSSCGAPTAPSNSSISYTGFTANWTKPGTAPTNGYVVAYKATSATTTPADGITESAHTGYDVVEVASGTTESASITSNLTAGETYDWWVRSRCTTGSSYSAWTSKTTVTIPKITAGTASGTSSYVAGSGSAGSVQTFTVSGVGLTGNLTVTAPSNFQVSTDGGSTWSTSGGSKTITASGTLESTTVKFRLVSDLSQGSYGPSNVVVSGGGAASVNVSVSGSVGAACSAAPTVSAATSSARTTSSITVNCAGISSLGTGTCTIDHYGFVYGTSSNPKHTSDDSGTGTVVEKGTTYTTTNTAFGSTTISGLTAGQTYYIRPYAHNSCGWAYGDQVTVTTLDLSSIAITTGPTKTAYFVGETFASAGAVVTATYTDASTATVSANWTPTTALSAGSQTITATYTENGTTKTATTTVNVYSVTVNKQDEDGTDISASGVSATWTVGTKALAASEGSTLYKFKTWKYGTASGTAFTAGSTDANLNTVLTGTPNGNVVVIAEFYKPVAVSWTSNGVAHTAGVPAPTSSVKRGTQWKDLQLPSNPSAPSSCSSKVFMGWTNQVTDWYSGDSHNSAPSKCLKSFAGETTAINDPIEFKAVFATASGGGADANTVLWSENWTGFSDASTPSGPGSPGTGSTVYGGASIGYSWNPGTGTDPGTSRVTTLNNGNLAGGTSPEAFIGKAGSGSGAKGGYLTVSGIKNGGASVITVSYKQNAYSLTVSASGSGYSGSKTANSKNSYSFDVSVDAECDNTFSLTFQAGGTSNVRVDDIEVKVKTSGTTYSDYATKCCNMPTAPTVTVTPGTETATVEWTTVTGNNGYQLKVEGSSSHNTWTDATSGVSVTGLTCGGESYTAYVRAKGNTGSGYCEYGAEGSSAFVTSSCACSYYSFHFGTDKSADWNTTNYCFVNTETSDGNTGNFYILSNFTMPAKPDFYLGWQGSSSDNAKTKLLGIGTIPFDLQRTKTIGTYSDGNTQGAIGTLRVRSSYNDDNKYIGFIPGGYVLRLGTDGTGWTSHNFTPASANYYETVWTTDIMELTSAILSGNAYVGLKTSDSYVWNSTYSQSNAINGNMGQKSGADTWGSNLSSSTDVGKHGKFRIWADNTNKNWNLHFVPYYQLTYNANGGSGSMSPLPATPVSCEETAANRTVTVAANGFTAPTGHQFVKWNTADNGSGSDVATGDRELTGDITLYAQWEPRTYDITLNKGSQGDANSAATVVYNSTSLATITHVTSTHYNLTGYFTLSSGGVKVLNNDGSFANSTVSGYIEGGKWTRTEATELFAQWEAKTYTVAWMVNGSSYSEGTPSTSATYNTQVATIPTAPSAPGDCSSKVFRGWSATNVGSGDGHDDPGDLFTTQAASPAIVANNTTFYAVFADEHSGSTTQWVKQSEITDYETGTYVLITAANYVFNGSISSGRGQIVTSGAISFTDNVATSLPSGYQELTLTRTGTKLYKLSRTRYNEPTESYVTEYLFINEPSEGNLRWSDTATYYRWYNSDTGGPLRYSKPKVVNKETRYGYLRTNGVNSSGEFRTYNAQNGNTGDAGKVYLVKKTTVVGTTYDNYVTTCTPPTQVATPVISPNTTAHTGDVSVTITCATDGAAIYYTTDGGTPTSSSTLYEGAFTVSCSGTVKAIGIKAGLDNSAVASQAYTITVPRPIFSPLPVVGNDFHTDQNVTITLQDPGLEGASIYYTTDGTDPSSSSTLYTGAISVTSGSTTIKAIGYKSCCTSSEIVSKTYRVRYGTDYTLVTDENDLMAGDKIVIISSTAGTSTKIALSTRQNDNNRGATDDYDINAGLTTATIYPAIGGEYTADVFTLVGEPGNWSLQGLNGSYIGIGNSEGDYLKTYVNNGGAYATEWSIGITSNIATITNKTYTGRSIQYNSGSPRFAGYTTGNQTSVKIYSLPNPTPVIKVEGTFSAFGTCYGTASSSQTIYVSGRSLTGSMVISGPAGYEFSSDGSSYSTTLTLVPSTGRIARQEVYVRIAATAASGAHNGNVNVAVSVNSLSTNVAVTGSVSTADIYIDQVHNTIVTPLCGSYSAPSCPDEDVATSGSCNVTHYKFMGWVTAANIASGLANDAAYKAVIITAGTAMTASGTTYYAVWAEEE